MSDPVVLPESVLFITLDSCRYDTFERANTPNLKSIAPAYRAKAPSHFTYASHAAMFVGFTPSMPGIAQPFLDSKYKKIFKLKGAGLDSLDGGGFSLDGSTIIEGFKRLGYKTIGSGAVRWFDPQTEAGRFLTQDFDLFYYGQGISPLSQQIRWLSRHIIENRGKPVFVFLNIGETHVPYYFSGADWDWSDNPCTPYQIENRSAECRFRQRACLEYIDSHLGELFRQFERATVLVCGDHGDCWGEDGLWEHGVSHEMTLTVPLLIRLRGIPIRKV